MYARDVKYEKGADATNLTNAVGPFQVNTLNYVVKKPFFGQSYCYRSCRRALAFRHGIGKKESLMKILVFRPVLVFVCNLSNFEANIKCFLLK